MTDKQYDDAILDSNAIDPTDVDGNPIPVTIPIMLAPGVKVVYTTRLGGTSEGDYAHCNLGGKSGDDPNHVLANRVALSNAIDAKLSLVSQVHSGVAVDVDELFVMNRPFGFDVSGGKGETAQQVGETADEPAVVEADGQVTAQKNVALGMFAADCLPVLMADPEAGVIGAAHCGRRGLQNGVIGATIEKMVSKGARPERIVATLGPCICGDCYEVGGDIADEFDAQFPGTFTLSRFGQPGIDIAAAALQELAKAGVPADNVVSSRARVNAATQYLSEDEELAEICQADGEGEPQLAERFKKIRRSLCTLENPLWFSHRRATIAGKAHEGRMLALIVRELHEFCDNGPEPDELSRCREQVKTNLLMGLESTGTRMMTIGRSELLRGEVSAIEQVLGAYDRVTADDLLALARRVFDFSQASLAVVGQPEKQETYRALLQ